MHIHVLQDDKSVLNSSIKCKIDKQKGFFLFHFYYACTEKPNGDEHKDFNKNNKLVH